MNRRIVGVFTGNRAEFGLLVPVIRAVLAHPDLDLRLYVSGGHLDTKSSHSVKEILDEGLEIYKLIEPLDFGRADGSVPSNIASYIQAISSALVNDPPDLFVVYADRFEGFAAVVSSSQLLIPTAHIEGGDVTDGGTLDDSIRHAMTKLSHLHFTTHEQAKNRVLSMGEEVWRVHNVGLPALDAILSGDLLEGSETCECLGLDPLRPIVVFTLHPQTTFPELAGAQIGVSLAAIEVLLSRNIQVIATYPNNDEGSVAIVSALKSFDSKKYEGFTLLPSLGRRLYHSVLSLAKDTSILMCCMGNSSSGIKETPIFGCPTVNIGNRQLGRMRAENVIDVDFDVAEIVSAVERCFDDRFREQCRLVTNPYGDPGVGIRIAKVLAETPLGSKLIVKKMTLEGRSENGWYR